MILITVPKRCNFRCSAAILLSFLAGQTGRRRAAWLLRLSARARGGACLHAITRTATSGATCLPAQTPAAAVTAHSWHSYKQCPSKTPLPAPALPAPRCCACCPPALCCAMLRRGNGRLSNAHCRCLLPQAVLQRTLTMITCHHQRLCAVRGCYLLRQGQDCGRHVRHPNRFRRMPVSALRGYGRGSVQQQF
jgi:hypothetical protein